MRGSNFIPIVAAGVVGIAIGWAVAPDNGDLREDLAARMDGMAGQMQSEIQKLQTSVSELSQQAAAPADDAVAQTRQAIADLGTRLDQLGSDLQARTDTLGQSLQTSASEARDAASAKLDELAASVEGVKSDLAAAMSAPAEDQANADAGDAATLAGNIGNTGAILLPGQSAIFAGQTVELVAIDAEAGTATLAVAGGEEQEITSGDAIDAGNNCQVTLAGVAAGAAYFGSENCTGAVSSGGDQQAAATAPAADAGADAPQAQASETAQVPAGGEAPSGDQEASMATAEEQAEVAAQSPTEAQAAQPAAAPTDGSADVQAVPVGGTASFGDTRIFVSSIGENDATLFAVGGGGRETVAVGSALDAGNGCSVTVESIADGQVLLTGDGCSGEAADTGEASTEPAPATESADTPNPAAPAENTEAATQPDAAPASDPAGDASTQLAGDSGVTIGQTATFGEKKVFVSGLSDSGAVLYVVGGGRQQVEAGAVADLGDGCTVTVDRIEDRMVYLTPAGC